jgi:hypothetical protein
VVFQPACLQRFSFPYVALRFAVPDDDESIHPLLFGAWHRL